MTQAQRPTELRPTELRPTRSTPIVAFILSFCWLVCGCDVNIPGRPLEKDRPILPSDQTDPETLFVTNCAGCHGKQGQRGPAPPLADALFLSIISDEQLMTVIRNGRVKMPGFKDMHTGRGSLTDDQISLIITYMRNSWGNARGLPADPPPYQATSPGNAETGREKFATYCAKCHSENGKGSFRGGALNNPAFLELISDQALRRFIITGRADLRYQMPNYVGLGKKGQPLTSQEISDIVAFLDTWRFQTSNQSTEPADSAKSE